MRLKAPIATILIAAAMAVAAPSTASLNPPAAGAGVPRDGSIEFAVFRKGEQIGTHKIGFQEKDNRLQVEVSAELKVQMLFVTVYRHVYRKSHLDQVLFSIGVVYMSIAAVDYFMGTQQQFARLPGYLQGRIESREARPYQSTAAWDDPVGVSRIRKVDRKAGRATLYPNR